MTRTEGMGAKGWWFSGGKSFMSNGYVIYSNGLDGEPPNYFGLLQGRSYAYRLFDQRSSDGRSSYHQFITHLTTIADRAAENEHRHLELKLQQLRKSSIDVRYLDKIEQAIREEEYGAAYTLLLRRDKDLDEFRREINSKRNKSFSRTNEFFNSPFFKYVAKRFEQQLRTQSGNTRTLELDTDFEKLVDEFFNDALHTSYEQNASLGFIRQTFIDQLQRLAQEMGGSIRISLSLDELKASAADFKAGGKIPKGKIITQKKNFRSPRVLADNIAQTLMKNIGKGLSTEVYAIGALEQVGTRAFATGNRKIDIENMFNGTVFKNESGKNDFEAYDIFSAEISIDDIVQDMYGDGYDESMNGFFSELERRVVEAAKETESGEFFKLAGNVKGYMSNADLQIAGTGSFSNRMSAIKKLDLDGNMTDKLIFMLNNTTSECIMSDRIEYIEDYLASVCLAWMWDNSEEVFDLRLDQPINYKQIYLFNSGGAYFTSSQILYQTINRLVSAGYDEGSNRFVKVGITPPAVYGNYQALKQKYPVTGIKDKDQWQAVLKQRWDEVRNDAMQSGALSIHFDQRELNELLGNLKAILNQ